MAEVFANSVHEAWLQAATHALAAQGHQICPLTVTIQRAPNGEWDDLRVRKRINALLARQGKEPIENVASTIFPWSLWRPGMPREQFFARYRKNLKKLRSFAQNRKGIYFERLTDYPGDQDGKGINQLDKIIEFYRNGTRRRSAFQATPYAPSKDLSGAPYLHFPCLQQVAFVPSNGHLNVIAFYPLHYLFQRAYGNYLGLLHLGDFMAAEMELSLEKLICVASVAVLEDATATVVRPFLERFVAH